MHVGNYLGLVDTSERQLILALTTVASHHRDEPDVKDTATLLATWSYDHVEILAPLIARYSDQLSEAPEGHNQTLFHGPRTGSLGLLRDLHDLYLLAREVQLAWIVLTQAALALRDGQLEQACQECGRQTERQIRWLRSRIAQAAPQSLVVAS
jgi:hypothetical protein